MGILRREVPFGSDSKSGKRSLYRIADPFLRLWFRVVAPNRAALAEAPAQTRLLYWHKHRAMLEGEAWEELCRLATARLHLVSTPLQGYGPFEPAQRYWKGREPEVNIVARSVDGRRLLVGEAKWSASAVSLSVNSDHIPGASDLEVVPILFAPEGSRLAPAIDAHMVMQALR